MTVPITCDNCGWPVTENTEHRKDTDDGLCVVYQDGNRIGFKRRRTPPKRMYR